MTAALVSMASLPAAMVAVSPTATWVMAMLVPPACGLSPTSENREADPSERVIPSETILIENDEGVTLWEMWNSSLWLVYEAIIQFAYYLGQALIMRIQIVSVF